MPFLEQIRSQVPSTCFVDKCEKEQCSVSMQGMPDSRLIIDCDKSDFPLSQNQVRCDYLVAVVFPENQNFVIPLEFKSGKIKKEGRQLQAGADYVQEIISSSHFRPRLKPILACKKVGKHKRIEIRKQRIRFFEKEEPIELIRCGDLLHQALF